MCGKECGASRVLGLYTHSFPLEPAGQDETARAARLGKVRAVVVLGSKSVRLRAGAKATASIRLVSGASEIAARGKLAARIRVVSSDGDGNTATRTTPVTLRIPRR